MNINVISAKNITKFYQVKIRNNSIFNSIQNIFSPKYEPHIAIDNVSLELFRGESLAFLGPNGAGKSTLIKILCGIQKPDFGEVTLLGQDPSKRNHKLYKKIGVVFGHKCSLWWDLSLEYSMEMAKVLYGLDDHLYRKKS